MQGQGLTVWFTGLSGSGKTTLATAVQADLAVRGVRAMLLDADDIRKTVNRHLGFSKEDRDENIRRIGMVAHILTKQGAVVLVAAISPYRAIREEMRAMIGNFVEVYVDAPLKTCEARDPKGLYAKARAGKVKCFTGIDAPYEPPNAPELIIPTGWKSVRGCTERVVGEIMVRLRPERMSPERLAEMVAVAENL